MSSYLPGIELIRESSDEWHFSIRGRELKLSKREIRHLWALIESDFIDDDEQRLTCPACNELGYLEVLTPEDEYEIQECESCDYFGIVQSSGSNEIRGKAIRAHESDQNLTEVVFRVFKDGGDVVALFPNIQADLRGNCLSYQSVGQHGAADYGGVLNETRPAKEGDFKALKKELERIGYNLKIKKGWGTNENNTA